MSEAITQTQKPQVRVLILRTVGSTPREAGAAMLVSPDGQSGTIGGGVLEWNAAKRAREMLEGGVMSGEQSIALGPELGQCCGGRVDLSFEQIDARPAEKTGLPVFLYGAGHVGREITRVLAGLPFALNWVDISEDRFPTSARGKIVKANPAAAVQDAPNDAFHFVLTHSHAHDLEICHQVLSRPFGHLGLIGSESKKARFLKRLRDLGHAEATLARLQCPIGDKRLGKTPQGIAIGVAYWLMRRHTEMNEPRGEGHA